MTRSLAATLSHQVGQRLPHLPARVVDSLVPPLVALWLSPDISPAALADGVQAAISRQAGDAADGLAPTAGQLFAICRVLRTLWVGQARGPASHSGPASVGRAHAIVDAAVGFVADAFVHEEALLAHSRAQFALIIDAIPQLVWRTTVTGEATFANQRFLEHVGCRLEDVLGWGWLSYIHPEDQARVGEEWARCRAADQAVSVAFRVRDAHGAYRWFLSLGNPFRDQDGTTVAYYGTWTDFDSHTQVVRALEEAVNARDTFLSVASHELKTPLTALSMRTQMRLRRLGRAATPVIDSAQAAGEDLGHIDRMTRLVDDMLDVARLERGHLQFVDEPLDLGALVEATVRRNAYALEAARCPWTVSCEVDIGGRWDPLRLEQAVTNLLNNCARYAKGAPVAIRTRRARADLAVVEVTDGGPGVAPQDQERIFGRFERAVDANSASGLGLGLHLVRHIAEHYGGGAAVESLLGQGSTFRVHLPLTLGPGGPKAGGQDTSATGLPAARAMRTCL